MWSRFVFGDIADQKEKMARVPEKNSVHGMPVCLPQILKKVKYVFRVTVLKKMIWNNFESIREGPDETPEPLLLV